MEASKKAIAKNKLNDHWAFLEHIEAPMWADLTIEANSGGEDISDDWFNISHPFHQLSACELKSKFSQHGSGEEILESEVTSQAPVSPELPSSVSRSRGKHYKSKKWGGINLNILLDKHQGLNSRCSQGGSRFGKEVKAKSNVSRKKGLSIAKLGERNARGNGLYNGREAMATGSNLMTSSSSVDNMTSQSYARSTITSDNSQQQKKYIQVSSQACNQKSVPLAIRRVGLRKSYVSKNTARPEIDDESMQSKGRKSSSGKSSVGSCSNPGSEVKFTAKQQREKITEGKEKDVVTMNLVDKNKYNNKPARISRTSTITVEGAKSSNKGENNINFAKPAYHRTAKSVVQYQNVSSRGALLPVKVNENSSTGAKDKPLATKVISFKGKGKENAARNVNSSTGAKEKPVTAKVISFKGKGNENAARNVAVHQKCAEGGVLALGN